MRKRFILTASAVLAFGFGSAPRSNAGTEIVEPYNAPAPNYTYAPPPRPVYYVPPPVVNVVVAPAYGYGYFGPRFAYYHSHQFFGRHGYRHFHRHY